MVFFSFNNSYRRIVSKTSEPAIFIYVSLILLIFSSILVGYFIKDALIGPGSNFLGSSTFLLP